MRRQPYKALPVQRLSGARAACTLMLARRLALHRLLWASAPGMLQRFDRVIFANACLCMVRGRRGLPVLPGPGNDSTLSSLLTPGCACAEADEGFRYCLALAFGAHARCAFVADWPNRGAGRRGLP